MKSLLDELIPQGRRALALWFIFSVVFFAVYYFSGPYSDLRKWYYEDCHKDSPGSQVNQSETNPDSPVTIAHIKATNVVADFMDSQVIITLRNDTNEVQSATVGFDVDLSSYPKTRVYIRSISEDSRPQNIVTVKDIPPQAEVPVEFALRVTNGDLGDRYKLAFILNGQSYLLQNPVTVTCNLYMRFKMWVVSSFLSPPGSHVVIPIIAMLFIVWLESLSTMLKRRKFGSGCWSNWNSKFEGLLPWKRQSPASSHSSSSTSSSGGQPSENTVDSLMWIVLCVVFVIFLVFRLRFLSIGLILAILFYIFIGICNKDWLTLYPWFLMIIMILIGLFIVLPWTIPANPDDISLPHLITWQVVIFFVMATSLCFLPPVYNWLGRDEE